MGMSVRDFTTLGALLFLLRRTDLNPGSGSEVLRRTKINPRVKARGLVSDVIPPGDNYPKNRSSSYTKCPEVL